MGAQVERPDARVLQLVQELADGPLPAWDPPPSALILNKAGTFSPLDMLTGVTPSLSKGDSVERIVPLALQECVCCA